MPGAVDQSESKKETYIKRLHALLDKYTKVMTVHVDMVTSNQIQKVRKALRGHGELLMGKNTLIRKGIRDFQGKNPAVMKLLDTVKTNVGMIFTNGDLKEIRTLIDKERVPAPARVGVIAPLDVTVPKQQTALEPTMTSFFQALNIATKINKGAIEIVNDVHLIKKGDRVGASESALLAKLNIKPFSYGLELVSLYDNGAVYAPRVLDLSDDDLLASFAEGIANIAAVSMQIGVPTLASLPYSINNSYRNLLAVAVELDLDIPEVKAMKAAASAAPVAAPTQQGKAAEPAAKAAEPAKDESEEELGLGLFD